MENPVSHGGATMGEQSPYVLEAADSLPCLLYHMPHDPHTTLKLVLHTTVTCLGRLTSQQVEPPDAGHLRLDLPTVSRRHARILCIDGEYELQNWHGRYGIGLYEQELQPGESYRLVHGDVFRIPAREAHVRL